MYKHNLHWCARRLHRLMIYRFITETDVEESLQSGKVNARKSEARYLKSSAQYLQ